MSARSNVIISRDENARYFGTRPKYDHDYRLVLHDRE